uniref:EF-hand domain-containing protein n=1 Tax=uncultured bacterium fosmid I5J7 TaxID=1701911 RepID=A0A1B0THA6_9BACT|nr:conserved hypothetical protein [uncultured bacterium fosmid I5J7]
MRRFPSRVTSKLTVLSAAILLASGFAVATAWAQSEVGGIKLPASIELPEEFVRGLARIENKAELLKKALAEYTRIDADGNGVSQADLDRIWNQRKEQQRWSAKAGFFVYDTNQDDILLREEIIEAIESGPVRLRLEGKQKDQRIRLLMMLFRLRDSDNDGKLTLAEFWQFHATDRRIQTTFNRIIRPKGAEAGIMTLDFDRDGTVSRKEFTAAISQINPNRERSQIGQHNIRIAAPGCELPAAGKDELVVFVAGERGVALSTVSTAGQDEVTTASELIIEDGDEPLYVIVSSSQSVLWSFKGATQRVSRVFVSSEIRPDFERSGSGVAGIDPSRVHFVEGKHCLKPVYGTGGKAEARTMKAIWNATGREPDRIVATAKFGTARLPDGVANSELESGYLPEHLQHHRRFKRDFTGGLFSVEADKVVSLRQAEAYQVLPGYAGLQQLQEEGRIEKTDDRTYQIKKVTRIPAGLGWAGSAAKFVFMLPTGFDLPKGDLYSACVIFEATGDKVGFGAGCRQ